MKKLNPNWVTPQSFETNDNKWGIKVVEEGMLELWNYEDYEEFKILISAEELEKVYQLIRHARYMNPYAWKGDDNN